jgi:hypothetical protein
VRRFAPPAIVIVVGLLLVTDLLLVNPTVDAVATVLTEYLVLLAAAGALAGGIALAVRHGSALLRREPDPAASIALLVGLAAMLLAGLRPGSAGAADPAVGWLVAALLVPLGAGLFALLFFTTLGAARRSLARGRRDTALMVAVASVVLVMLLPLGGTGGSVLASVADWTLTVPIGAVFRGLLIGVAAATAVAAARTVLSVDGTDE